MARSWGFSATSARVRSVVGYLCNGIFGGIIAAFIVIVTVVVLVCALEFLVSKDPNRTLACSSRSTTEGFVENSDFYGLGIRAGIYLQWVAALIAGAVTPEERGDMVAAYSVFSFALWVALLVLIFQRACAFTAEIIVILDIFYGGAYLILWLSMPSHDLHHHRAKAIKGMKWTLLPMFWFVLPISLWFWLYMATNGEGTFAPTPGGTTFFLLTQVKPEHMNLASKLMAMLCFTWACPTLFMFIIECLRKMQLPLAARTLMFFGPSGVFWLVGVCCGRPVELLVKCYREFRGKPGTLARREEKEELHGTVVFASIGFSIIVWSILSVELTLKWNSISDVYSIDSTGQIIPFVAGLCLLLNILWRLGGWAKYLHTGENILRRLSLSKNPQDKPMELDDVEFHAAFRPLVRSLTAPPCTARATPNFTDRLDSRVSSHPAYDGAKLRADDLHASHLSLPLFPLKDGVRGERQS